MDQHSASIVFFNAICNIIHYKYYIFDACIINSCFTKTFCCRYLGYYWKCKVQGIKPVMDFINLENAKHIYGKFCTYCM